MRPVAPHRLDAFSPAATIGANDMTGFDPGRSREATAQPRDVRMRGFSRRAEVADVWQWIDRHATLLPAEPVAIDDAHGRVLARDVIATADVPAFDRSAMDGRNEGNRMVMKSLGRYVQRYTA